MLLGRAEFQYKASLRGEPRSVVEVLTLILKPQSGRDSCRAIRQKDVKEASESAPNTSPFTQKKKKKKEEVERCWLFYASLHFFNGWKKYDRRYRHFSIGQSSNLSELSVRLLRLENQELDGIADDSALHRDQRAGHRKHLNDKSRQPSMRKPQSSHAGTMQRRCPLLRRLVVGWGGVLPGAAWVILIQAK